VGEQLQLFFDSAFSLRLTIEDAMRIFWDNYWSHLPFGRKSHAHRDRILSFFKGHYLDTISKADVERLRRWMLEMGFSPSTTNKTHMMLSRIYTKFAEYKEGKFVNGTDFSRIVLPDKNPAGQVPRVNERQFARQLEITKERKQLLCSFADEDLYEIIDGLWWTTIRQGDFFAITSDNVDLDRRIITGIQRKSVTTKNPSGLPFKVAIPVGRLEMIKRRLLETKPGTPIFRRKNMQKRWNAVREMASRIDPGLAKAQLRDIRGGSTSFLLRNGVDIETVQKKGGWADRAMIPHYDKRGDEPVREATEKLVEV
jgi:hypothetical protein